jgi:small ligand-binding sensory domain FIST
VSVRAGAGLSIDADPLAGAVEAAQAAAKSLDGGPADMAVVFASGSHLAAPEATLEGVWSVLEPRQLVGCGCGGVIGAGRELESGTAVAVWAASFDTGGEARAFHATADSERIDGLPAADGATGLIMLSDPYSFPTDAALAQLSDEAPGLPVLGGIASARTQDGAGVTLHGVELSPCVSQGAAPLGHEVTITAAEGNVIHELAGKPALHTIERLIAQMDPRDQALVAAGLLVGIVIDSGKPDYERGDFLVRGVLGADPDTGAVAVGATVREGQVIRLHARDARSADEDLHERLRAQVLALDGRQPAGALLFSCNGRGRAMFGSSDHDAAALARELGGAPAAGFFAAGEIGPVGGRSFLHGFTATVAVFPA